MRIILQQDIPSFGRKNEVKDVSDGYARNFLFQRKLAKPATEEMLKILSAEKNMAEEKKSTEQKKLEELMGKLAGMVLKFKVKVGAKGRAFGSVTALKIQQALEKQGVKVEKDWVELKDSIKTAGEHVVKIKFPQGIKGEIKVAVEAE